jgi:integrase
MSAKYLRWANHFNAARACAEARHQWVLFSAPVAVLRRLEGVGQLVDLTVSNDSEALKMIPHHHSNDLQMAAAHYAPISKRSIPPENFPAVITRIAHSGRADAARIAEYLELLAATGIRPVQVEQMTLEHLSCGGGRILVPHANSGRTRMQTIDANAERVVARITQCALMRRIAVFDRVFPDGLHKHANEAIADACASLGIDRFTCSTLRTFHQEQRVGGL